jgi:hypothetical protein
MKKLMLLAVIVLFTSCDAIFAPITFKLIGSGTMSVGLSEDGTYSSSNMTAQSFDVNSSGTVILTAQSNDGTGCKIEAYIGKELIKQASASGYGVASVTIEN